MYPPIPTRETATGEEGRALVMAYLRCQSVETLGELQASWRAGVDGLSSWELPLPQEGFAGLDAITYWRDRSAFESWKHQQKPKQHACLELVVDLQPQWNDFLSWGNQGVIISDLKGTILDCYGCFLDFFQCKRGSLTGRCLWSRLVQADAGRIQAEVECGISHPKPFFCNFVSHSGQPFTMQCSLSVQGEAFSMLCIHPHNPGIASLTEELLELNNQLATKTREIARQNKALLASTEELKRVHLQLEQSHWHIKKIHDCLPICLNCDRVKTEDNHWEELHKYLRSNSDFLSHGYCPQCHEKISQAWGKGD